MGAIEVDKLQSTLSSILTEYANKETEIVKDAVEATAKDTVSDLKATSPVHIGSYTAGTSRKSGDYAKGWKFAKESDKTYSIKTIVYNKKHYRLTHLLEYGHDIVNKDGRVVGRARSFPHIKPAETRAIEKLTSKLMTELQKGGK